MKRVFVLLSNQWDIALIRKAVPHKMMVAEKCEGDLVDVGSIDDEGRVIYEPLEKTAKAGLLLFDIKPENMLLCGGEAKMTDLDADWAYVETVKIPISSGEAS